MAKKSESQPSIKAEGLKKTLLELWLDNYALIYLPKHLSMGDNEQIAHKLISDLIVMGSDDETSYSNGLHNRVDLLKHEELINAVMVQIKPGFCAHFL